MRSDVNQRRQASRLRPRRDACGCACVRLTAGLEPGVAVRCALHGYTIMYMMGMVGITLCYMQRVQTSLTLHKLVRAIRHTSSSVISLAKKCARVILKGVLI